MRFIYLFIALLMLFSTCAAKDEFQAADFIKQHLNSIGNEQARAAVKTRVAQGTATFEILNAGPTRWDGPETLVSEGDKLASLMKFPATVYRTEWFVSDGRKTRVAQIKPGDWSAFGRFVMTHDEILKEGLWGGTLTTTWALSHWEERHAKLQDRGLKTVDDRQLHRVNYVPKKNSDLEIELYFEPDTFRHVMTVYSMTVSARTLGNASASRYEQEVHYRLEERFADFKSIDNLTLPARWTIQFTYGGPSLETIDQFDVREDKISHNLTLDPKNFEIK